MSHISVHEKRIKFLSHIATLVLETIRHIALLSKVLLVTNQNLIAYKDFAQAAFKNLLSFSSLAKNRSWEASAFMNLLIWIGQGFCLFQSESKSKTK